MARLFNKKSHELAVPSLIHGVYVYVNVLASDATYRKEDREGGETCPYVVRGIESP
jgi:hypothetical protein